MYFRNKNNSFRRNKEFCNEDEDVGIVYTRDKYGRLETPKGYGIKLGDKSYLHDVEPKAASCSIQDNEGKTSPCSLYLISLDFVAKNITMVESLYGFPDIVGKDLFDRVNTNDIFTQSWNQTFQLFIDAYGSLVLDKLSLKRQCIAVNELDYLKCFTCISELDLSHCRLGSNHELLLHVSKLSSLTRLSLRDNCLHDIDIKLFTLPLRVMKVGPINLTLLDLSSNPGITNTTVRYLAGLQSLVGLNLSGTSISINDGIHKLTKETGMILDPQFAGFGDDNEIQTEGWATCVIKAWLASLKRVRKQPKAPTNSKVNSFYTQKTKASILQENNSTTETPRETESTVLVLTRVQGLHEKMKEKGKYEWENERENKWDSGNERDKSKHESTKVENGCEKEKERNKTNHKRKQQSLDDDEGAFVDHDIMQLYMNNSVEKTDSKKRKLSLANLQ